MIQINANLLTFLFVHNAGSWQLFWSAPA